MANLKLSRKPRISKPSSVGAVAVVPAGPTSTGSMLAAAGGIVGTVTPFIPVQYQMFGAMLAAVLGTLATKIP